jgi:nicotinamidase-related amidase
MKLALLVIDMQKAFLADFPDPKALEKCCEYINHVSGLVRTAGHQVIHIQDVEGADTLSAEELDFIEQIEIDPSDLKVTKKESNAFWETDLERIVTERGFDLLILCGQAAEHCVVFTYNGAWERGHRAVILQHAVLSSTPGRMAHLQEDRHVISYPVVEALARS